LDELTKLDSYTKTGLDYEQYSDRLLTAKGNIDVALQRTTDLRAKAKIEAALSYYIHARESWKQSLDRSTRTTFDTFVRHYWGEGSSALARAKRYVVADEKTRREIDAEAEKEQKEAAARWEQEKKAAAKQLEQDEKRAKEAEQQRRAAAEAAERERARRFAPEGVVYNLRQVTVTLQGGLASIPPGTELRVTGRNADGTFHVQKDDLFADVQPSDVTNDRDMAAQIRARDGAEQEVLRQWGMKQAAAVAEEERRKYTPTPTPRR
jgi:ATPase subunit of ABC transporter with duplicated ATPase domains